MSRRTCSACAGDTTVTVDGVVRVCDRCGGSGEYRGPDMHNPPRCPYCTKRSCLVDGLAIYPNRPDLQTRMFYQCAPCGAYVGTHKGSARHAPLGTLANAELRALRRQVHEKLDPLWQGNPPGEVGKIRNQVYDWLAKRMGLDVRRCHVAHFREAQCMAALLILADHHNRRHNLPKKPEARPTR